MSKYIEVGPVIDRFYKKGIYIYYICGGRGIGKSYSAYDLCRKIGEGTFAFDPDEKQNKFMYLRRTAVEAESVASPEGNAFKKYNQTEGVKIIADYSQKLGFGNWYLRSSVELENGETEEYDKHIGYIASVSTFANLRGVDFSDVQFILFDECIPESRYKAPIKREGFLLLNIFETINRNRELLGKPACVLCMISNPIDLSNAMLSQLNLTPVLSSMILKGQQRYTDRNRHMHIEKLTDHRISQEKKNTVLYQFAKGTGFDDESLSGDFVGNDLSIIKKPVLSEYNPIVTIEDVVTLYEHKSNGSYHISTSISKAKYHLKVHEKERIKSLFYWKYKLLILDNAVTFDNYSTKVVLEQLINYKSA